MTKRATKKQKLATTAGKKRSPPATRAPSSKLTAPSGYAEWLADVKARIHAAQQRAAFAVNRELLTLYWTLGRDILERQQRHGWGAGIVDKVAADLRAAFPSMKGFSRANLMYMRAFAEAWPQVAIVQQAVGQLPWGHNLVLLTKLKDHGARLAYAAAALEHGWSRAVLVHHIEARTVERQGKALTNFAERLPKPQSDLARESLKDPYRFDFLGIGNDATELELEGALIQHITRFLLELGAGFAFVGRQVHLEVGGDDFFLDLLFYHLKLRAYVVIELKATDFKPEHLGQLGFYLTAIDTQVKAPEDAPTIGLLLCKSKNKVVAEYALRDGTKPMGIAEYQLVQALPAQLETSLPSVERIEAELAEPKTSTSADTPTSSRPRRRAKRRVPARSTPKGVDLVEDEPRGGVSAATPESTPQAARDRRPPPKVIDADAAIARGDHLPETWRAINAQGPAPRGESLYWDRRGEGLAHSDAVHSVEWRLGVQSFTLFERRPSGGGRSRARRATRRAVIAEAKALALSAPESGTAHEVWEGSGRHIKRFVVAYVSEPTGVRRTTRRPGPAPVF